MMHTLSADQAALLPVQHLAWIGDAVYELYCRQELVVGRQLAPGQSAQKAAVALTSAHGQARVLEKVRSLLTERELDLQRRGRNCKGLPRSSAEYCQATGLEVVVGWLWLSGQNQRLEALFQTILEVDDSEG
ncbi:MAG: ribonuclease III [Firmicutes bacterium]|nr:ribonuclease III [Bacillota bacterium]